MIRILLCVLFFFVASQAESVAVKSKPSGKTAVIYYSYSGNTKSIAQKIAKELNADLFELEPATPYSSDNDVVVDQGKKEVESKFEPKLKPLKFSLASYDKVVLGTPVWWYAFAPVMRSFVNHADWKGKDVYPFATNAGWLGDTFKDFEKGCKGAKVHDGLNILFKDSNLRTDEDKIKKWIKAIK